MNDQTKETADLLPCPFCGSTKLRREPLLFCDDDGEHEGVECLECDAMNRTEHWNKRHPWQKH